MAPRIRRGGKRIRGSGVGRTRNQDCCCEDCCAEPGGPPTADFTYEQTDDSPCTFQFTDASTPGTCGSILTYLWDFGDGNTSTASSPSHTYTGSVPADGPWNVTLTITDVSGCVDSVIMEVTCVETHPCDCCTGAEMSSMTITLNMSGNRCSGGGGPGCSVFNGTYVLPAVGTFSGRCRFKAMIGSFNRCGTGALDYWMTVEIACTATTVDVSGFLDSSVGGSGVWFFHSNVETKPYACRDFVGRVMDIEDPFELCVLLPAFAGSATITAIT